MSCYRHLGLLTAAALLCAAAGVAHAQPSQGTRPARPAARATAPAAAPIQQFSTARTDPEALAQAMVRVSSPVILWSVLAMEPRAAAAPANRLQAVVTVAPASNRPAWVDENIDLTRARIARIVPGPADVVVLDRGLYQGLRVGTPCLVMQDGIPVGGLIVVASLPERAAALITSQAPNVDLRPGDQVRLKLFMPVPTL